MKPISQFQSQIHILLTDIDGTLTDKEGKIPSESYHFLWKLQNKGIRIIPVTGRSAGWCEMITRVWPVYGIIGENGAFYFYLKKKGLKGLKRIFALNKNKLKEAQVKREALKKEILTKLPNLSFASDQFSRLSDLAIDVREGHTLGKEKQKQIFSICHQQGAKAKLSSIHINAWFGSYDKLSMSLHILKEHCGLSKKDIQEKVAFIGDSPNDASMFAHFSKSIGVANIKNFSKKRTSFFPYLFKS